MNHESEKILQKASDLCNDERELEAEVLVKEQLTINPDDLKLMTKLGEIQARLCNDHEAEASFRTVLIRDPNYEDAVCGLGGLLDQSLRVEEAEQIYRDFLLGNPAGHHALEGLCRILLSETRIDESLELARNQVEKYSDHHSAYKALTYVLHILEDQLESDLNDDRENETVFTQSMNNLLEQLELVFKLEKFIEITEELSCEMDDEKNRLVGEIDHLLKSAVTRKITVSSELNNRVMSTLQIAKVDG